MRAKRFHGLKRLKIRQTWNKYNLYNLSRLKAPYLASPTHYQQKWKAKQTARAYHGEQVREKQWERKFSPRLRSVVSMDHRYLAACDGSEQAQGRGSGRELSAQQEEVMRSLDPVPYMQMTFAPTERRLDTAIFRALFASSARQARQFVVHGAVKVNGKKMIYPGYQLNPGDMFQVEPDRVMFATGAPKDAKERAVSRRVRKKVQEAKEVAASTEATEELSKEPTSEPLSTSIPTESSQDSSLAPADTAVLRRRAHKVNLTDILKTSKAILSDKKETPRAKQKQALRQLSVTVRRAIGNVNRTSVESLDDELNTLLSQLNIATAPPVQKSPIAGKETSKTPSPSGEGLISPEDRMALREAMREARDNPIDPRKPYATPWHPRPYMSAFAFIPRYLEVNQNICSAVYLRHPVARPGLSEVPTPFTTETSQLAFTWYLRRR